MVSRISRFWILSRPWMRVRATRWTCCKTILNSMIGRIRPGIQDRPSRTLRQLTWGRLLVGAAWCAAAAAAPPSPAPPTPPAPPAAASPGVPDDDFIEFLGADDVGDAAWWEFLKKVPPRRENPPATPPQEVKQ